MLKSPLQLLTISIPVSSFSSVWNRTMSFFYFIYSVLHLLIFSSFLSCMCLLSVFLTTLHILVAFVAFMWDFLKNSLDFGGFVLNTIVPPFLLIIPLLPPPPMFMLLLLSSLGEITWYFFRVSMCLALARVAQRTTVRLAAVYVQLLAVVTPQTKLHCTCVSSKLLWPQVLFLWWSREILTPYPQFDRFFFFLLILTSWYFTILDVC